MRCPCGLAGPTPYPTSYLLPSPPCDSYLLQLHSYLLLHSNLALDSFLSHFYLLLPHPFLTPTDFYPITTSLLPHSALPLPFPLHSHLTPRKSYGPTSLLLHSYLTPTYSCRTLTSLLHSYLTPPHSYLTPTSLLPRSSPLLPHSYFIPIYLSPHYLTPIYSRLAPTSLLPHSYSFPPHSFPTPT